MQERKEQVLETLTPMLKLSNILAAFPPYVFGLKARSTPISYKIYNFAIILLLMCLTCYQIYGKLTYPRFQSFIPTVRLTDYITNSVLTVFTLRTSILTFTKSGELKSFLFNLEHFDNSVPQYNRKKYLVQSIFLSLHMVTAATIIADTVAFGLSFGPEMVHYFLAKNFIYYHFCATLIMILWFGLELRFSYMSLNKLLQRTLNGLRSQELYLFEDKPEYLPPDFSTETIDLRDSRYLNKVASWHNDLCDIVEQYNNLFGTSLLLFVLFDISNILNNFVQVLVAAVTYSSEDDNSLLGYMVLMNICWIGTSLARTVMIAASFEFLEREARRTAAICYKMLNEVPTVLETEYDKTLREQLLYIAQQSDYRTPYVSAAGFFEINLGMMGFILTSITTYVIVIIEFVAK